jgi:hypothetical protein
MRASPARPLARMPASGADRRGLAGARRSRRGGAASRDGGGTDSEVQRPALRMRRRVWAGPSPAGGARIPARMRGAAAGMRAKRNAGEAHCPVGPTTSRDLRPAATVAAASDYAFLTLV